MPFQHFHNHYGYLNSSFLLQASQRRQLPDDTILFQGEVEKLRWFLLPSEAKTILLGSHSSPSCYPEAPFTPVQYPLSVAELNKRPDFVWEASEDNWVLRRRQWGEVEKYNVEDGNGVREQEKSGSTSKDEKRESGQGTTNIGSPKRSMVKRKTEIGKHCDRCEEASLHGFNKENNQSGKPREQQDNEIQPVNRRQEKDNKEIVQSKPEEPQPENENQMESRAKNEGKEEKDQHAEQCKDEESEPENENQMETQAKGEGKEQKNHTEPGHNSLISVTSGNKGDKTKESSQGQCEDSGEVMCEGLLCLTRRGGEQGREQEKVQKPVKVAAKWHSPPKNIFNPTVEVS